MSKKTISILGCGWLGYPLAKHLYSEGWQIKGSATSESKLDILKNNNISAFRIDLNNESNDIDSTFFQSEYLLINIPPGKLSDPQKHYKHVCQLIKLSHVKKIIFISSTSVYTNLTGVAYEKDTDDMADHTNRTLSFERLFQNLNKKVIILRFAGLIGPGRHPGRFFTAGKTISNPHFPVNLIHLDDCIGLIETILHKGHWGQIYNGCAHTHPSKLEFYGKASIKLGNPFPIINTTSADIDMKIVSNSKARYELGYEFKHYDLMKLLNEDAF